MNEQYFQIATVAKFIENGVDEASLATCRVIQQADTLYPNMRCCGDFQLTTGMVIRHLEFSNGAMQGMWANAMMNNDNAMIPFKIDEVNTILANEPQEV